MNGPFLYILCKQYIALMLKTYEYLKSIKYPPRLFFKPLSLAGYANGEIIQMGNNFVSTSSYTRNNSVIKLNCKSIIISLFLLF